jgi:RNA polymerase sigma-70 factor (ECF subfamily)
MNKMIYTDNITDNPHTNRQGIEPSEIHDKNERKQLLHKALLKLNKKEREVLVLSNFEGLKYKEIARILKCSEVAVKVRVYRAMQNLRIAYLKIQN